MPTNNYLSSSIRKNHPLVKLANDMLWDVPSPINLSYWWNLGSILGICLVVQIVTGIALAMHYAPNIELAFNSVAHIMIDVNYGWVLRYGHANGASLFFIAVYLHISRGLYYGSYTAPRQMLWNSGVIIFFLMMATAFIGYVLPWGQMSFWGATVITNFLSAIPYVGQDIVIWVWGGFSVDNATLNRFFSLHYLMPFVLAALVIIHLIFLHTHGSNNPSGLTSSKDKIPFHPYFTNKDIYGFVAAFLLLSFLIFYFPNVLGHPDNTIPANPLSTPAHIVPEWYFLFAYAILRAIPDKLGGVLALLASVIILFILPYVHSSLIRSNRLRPLSKIVYWMFIFNFFLLTWLGGNPVEDPYVFLSRLTTIGYFGFFFIQSPIGLLENVWIYI